MVWLSLIGSISAQPVTLKIATVAPEGSIWMLEINNLNKELQRKTRGEVKFQIYAGGVAGEETTVVKNIQLGTLDGAAFAGRGLGEIMSKIRVLELPFLYRQYEEWRYVKDRMAERLEKEFMDKGYMLLGWSDGGFAYLFSKDPIQNLDQFHKAKVWFYEGDSMIESGFRELKASGVPLGLTDVITSLQTGKVNCVYCPPYGLTVLRWHTYLQYCTDLPLCNVVGGLVITKKAYQRVPKSYQATLRTLSQKYIGQLLDKTRKANQETVELLQRQYNFKFVPPHQELVDESKVFSVKVADSQVDVLYPKELLDEARKLIQEYRQKNP